MKLLILLLAIAASGNAWSQETGPAKPDEAIEQLPAHVVDSAAEFPGGKEALHAYVKEHLQYPSSLSEMAVEGRCYVRFVVTKTGTLTDIQVVRGIPGCTECDKVATGIFHHTICRCGNLPR